MARGVTNSTSNNYIWNKPFGQMSLCKVTVASSKKFMSTVNLFSACHEQTGASDIVFLE